jgi:hypothetical protein
VIKQILFIFIFFPLLAFGDTPRGEALLNRLWKDMKAGNVKKIRHYTSDHFQATSPFGTFNRDQEMNFLKSLKIKSYRLFDVKVTEGENVITIWYKACVHEILGGAPPYSEMTVISRRIAVWKKCGNTWKWVAEGNQFTPTVLAAAQ